MISHSAEDVARPVAWLLLIKRRMVFMMIMVLMVITIIEIEF